MTEMDQARVLHSPTGLVLLVLKGLQFLTFLRQLGVCMLDMRSHVLRRRRKHLADLQALPGFFATCHRRQWQQTSLCHPAGQALEIEEPTCSTKAS